MKVVAFIMAVLLWQRYRLRVRNRAYHFPESTAAHLWHVCLSWLHWAVLLWLLLGYVEWRATLEKTAAPFTEHTGSGSWIERFWSLPSRESIGPG